MDWKQEENIGKECQNLHMIRGELMDRKYRDLIAYRVSKNIDNDFHIEALKCQAIIERTLLFRSIKDGSFKKENIDNTSIRENIYTAVDETQNLVIMVNNHPIQAFYHGACGGSTENSENVLNHKIDYLRRVTCEACEKNKNLSHIVDITLEDLASKFDSCLPPDVLKNFTIENILKILKRNESQRVESIEVFNKEVKGNTFGENLNLDSLRFGFRPIKIRFYTKGIGHGLGLCQYGANEKGKNNWNYKDILGYYYTNINICTVEDFNSKFPLKGKKFFIDSGHGGTDTGYMVDELKEKDITLKLGLYLKEELEKYGMEIEISREKDEYITLDERVKKIKQYKPEFLISIHLNESKFEGISGMEGYYYWGDEEGKNLGEEIIHTVSENLQIKNRGIREGKLYILKESGTNGVYFEVGYLSNLKEKDNFKNDLFIKAMAMEISQGILKYYFNKMLT